MSCNLWKLEIVSILATVVLQLICACHFLSQDLPDIQKPSARVSSKEFVRGLSLFESCFKFRRERPDHWPKWFGYTWIILSGSQEGHPPEWLHGINHLKLQTVVWRGGSSLCTTLTGCRHRRTLISESPTEDAVLTTDPDPSLQWLSMEKLCKGMSCLSNSTSRLPAALQSTQIWYKKF